MHHCHADKKIKKFSGVGYGPLPRPLSHWGGGSPLPRPRSPRRLPRLDSRAFGTRRSRSFSFTTRTLVLIARRSYRQHFRCLCGFGASVAIQRMTRNSFIFPCSKSDNFSRNNFASLIF